MCGRWAGPKYSLSWSRRTKLDPQGPAGLQYYSACQTHWERALREGAEPYLKIESVDRNGDGGTSGVS